MGSYEKVLVENEEFEYEDSASDASSVNIFASIEGEDRDDSREDNPVDEEVILFMQLELGLGNNNNGSKKETTKQFIEEIMRLYDLADTNNINCNQTGGGIAASSWKQLS